MPQLSRVGIEKGLEFVASPADFPTTGADMGIGEGTKIDKLVQIGHNICIGRGCVLGAQSGVAGSSDFVGRVSLGALGGGRRPSDHRKGRLSRGSMWRDTQNSGEPAGCRSGGDAG